MGWSGDPVWLADVLRAEGLEVREFPGWRDRGHGDFGSIWGVVAHHTGNNPPSNNPRYISEHPDLGLCSQLHLARDGVVTVCGVGVAWHAGQGFYPGLPTDNANYHTIGIEAENNGTEGWSDSQYSAYVKAVAAILRKLGYDSSHVIGHKEWAGRAQGKWDPGSMDMDAFRADVQKQIDNKNDEGFLMALNDADQHRVLFELTNRFPSRVQGSTFADTLVGYVLEMDRKVEELHESRKALEAKLDAVLAKVAA
ncbi:N-acetylmuramoyl-L-alanine amidase [Nocardia transvalensis]|nr:N-acetylmuramoyl-L-alanine amidase [Nocardia transvalensis]